MSFYIYGTWIHTMIGFPRKLCTYQRPMRKSSPILIPHLAPSNPPWQSQWVCRGSCRGSGGLHGLSGYSNKYSCSCGPVRKMVTAISWWGGEVLPEQKQVSWAWRSSAKTMNHLKCRYLSRQSNRCFFFFSLSWSVSTLKIIKSGGTLHQHPWPRHQ